jgi:hypothetical protein
MSDKVVSLEPRPNDADLAKQYRERMRLALEPVVALMNEASANGLEIGFQLGRDQYGRHIVMPIGVARPL